MGWRPTKEYRIKGNRTSCACVSKAKQRTLGLCRQGSSSGWALDAELQKKKSRLKPTGIGDRSTCKRGSGMHTAEMRLQGGIWGQHLQEQQEGRRGFCRRRCTYRVACQAVNPRLACGSVHSKLPATPRNHLQKQNTTHPVTASTLSPASTGTLR